jgi:hypothetical protein
MNKYTEREGFTEITLPCEEESQAGFHYRDSAVLTELIGQEMEFLGFTDTPKRGILEFDGTNFWLPFCGKVNAKTVKIKLS